MQSSSKIVTFTRPFILRATEGLQPAGTYTIDEDREPLPTYFPASRQVASWIRLPAEGGGGLTQVVPLDHAELADLLARDSREHGAPASDVLPVLATRAAIRVGLGPHRSFSNGFRQWCSLN